MYNLPRPIDLHLLKECGHPIGEWVWIRPNSSDWSGDWMNVRLMVVSIVWNYHTAEWEFSCIDEQGNDMLNELTLDDLSKYNMWE